MTVTEELELGGSWERGELGRETVRDRLTKGRFIMLTVSLKPT